MIAEFILVIGFIALAAALIAGYVNPARRPTAQTVLAALSGTPTFRPILDKYDTFDELQRALRRAGL